MSYYFDDNGLGDHWRMREFSSDAEALAWAEWLKEKHKRGDESYYCILYADKEDTTDDPFRTIKEWGNKDLE